MSSSAIRAAKGLSFLYEQSDVYRDQTTAIVYVYRVIVPLTLPPFRAAAFRDLDCCRPGLHCFHHELSLESARLRPHLLRVFRNS